MNTIDIIAGITILLGATGGFLVGGIVVLIETLQIVTTLLIVLSFKSECTALFSHFMSSSLLADTASVLALFALIYLVLSIGLSFIYKFLEPFKELFLNKLFGLIGGIIIGLLLFYLTIGFLSKRNYFKTATEKSYIYKIIQ